SLEVRFALARPVESVRQVFGLPSAAVTQLNVSLPAGWLELNPTALPGIALSLTSFTTMETAMAEEFSATAEGGAAVGSSVVLASGAAGLNVSVIDWKGMPPSSSATQI